MTFSFVPWSGGPAFAQRVHDPFASFSTVQEVPAGEKLEQWLMQHFRLSMITLTQQYIYRTYLHLGGILSHGLKNGAEDGIALLSDRLEIDLSAP